jgi:carbamoyltransferase
MGPGSPGRFYAKITQLCGFDWRKGEEGKVMGLAAYGRFQKDLAKDLGALIRCEEGQVIQPDESQLASVIQRLEGKHGFSCEDIACTGQKVFERIMKDLVDKLFAHGGSKNLVLGGGCALNSSFNGQILKKTEFEAVHVPCAPADDGNAAGAALLAFKEEVSQGSFAMLESWRSPYLGSSMDATSLARFEKFSPQGLISHHPGRIHVKAAEILCRGGIIGWIQGGAEYGPRALGNRSILADPRPEGMKNRINREVKFREGYRPFAPAILASEAENWFESPVNSPYMSFTMPWKPSVRERVPAVVHKDGTGRLQTVSKEMNPRFHDLISAFYGETGVPLVLNTSLNIMGRPIVHTLEDGIGLFFTTGLDAMVIKDFLIRKIV